MRIKECSLFFVVCTSCNETNIYSLSRKSAGTAWNPTHCYWHLHKKVLLGLGPEAIKRNKG